MNKNNFFLTCCLSNIAVALLVAGNANAQKSSGTIRGEIINNSPATVEQTAPKTENTQIVSDNVTSSVSATQNDVRFLLRPKNEAVISSQMAGVISDIQFNVGQRFKKGDTLVSLKCAIQNAQVAAQKARVREASLTYQSNKELLAGNAVSQYEVDITGSQLTQQKSLLREASIVASLCRVRAPFSGGVVSVDVNEFETVSLATPLLTVIDDSSLKMSLNVPSTLINKVDKGHVFTIVVDETGGSYQAKVTGVSPAIDPVSKTIELRAVLSKKSAELRPGMSGRAKLDFRKQ